MLTSVSFEPPAKFTHPCPTAASKVKFNPTAVFHKIKAHQWCSGELLEG
jgi:hypothetical protein